MKRFKRMFQILKKKREGAFIPFVVLGDPDRKTSLEVVKALVDAGADALEIGFAFSDPIADGPTVQEADQIALSKGIETNQDFSIIKKIRAYSPTTPISLLVYYNLIFQRGVTRFYRDAKNAGVDAVLAADCPVEEAGPLLKAARAHKIDQVFIVSPATTKKRLKKILEKCSGYVYLVALLGVTGARKRVEERTIRLIKKVRPHTPLPLCVGFGVSKPKHVKQVLEAGADGAIVGSAILEKVNRGRGRKKMLSEVGKFAAALKKATR